MVTIAQLYSALHRGSPGDAEFYRSICKGVRWVLELGCGHGRLTFELAQVCDFVVGVDQDSNMLKLADVRLETNPLPNVELFCADMAQLSIDRKFDRILIPFTTAFCLDRPRLKSCLAWCSKHLSADGILALDVYPAEIFHESDVSFTEFDHLENIEVMGVEYDVCEKTSVRRLDQEISVTYRHTRLGLDGDNEPIDYTIKHHYVLMKEWPNLLRNAGFSNWEFYGDFNGSSANIDADRFIVLSSN